MSNVIDNKVVELQLDNTNFEKNSKQSIKTLAQLEYAMNISTAETNKSLLEINKTLAAMPLQKIADGVDATAQRFTLLGQIGFSVINNLTNQLTNMATRMTMNLTMGQKQAGFSEYQLKMNATKTMMAGSGEDLATVNEQLEKLNEYADKTIYSFSDMTQNIGKFTNAGVKLEDSVNAIKGVSSLAALSGADSAAASRAMYNFAQALSQGSVKLIDWKSIENANMATKTFKELLIDQAEKMGTIRKEGEKYYAVLEDGTLDTKEAFDATMNFNGSLSKAWLTNDVLIESLKRLSNEEDDIGGKAMEAATEVRTFSAMMDALKESSGSAWSRTFELIFGDMEEATKLWTAINGKVTKWLDTFGEARNAPLEVLKENGGRTYLKNIFEVMGKGIKGFVDPIKQAWREVFPPWPKSWLLDLVQRLERFMTSLKGDAEAMHAVGQIFKFFFSILKVGINVIKSMFRGLKIFSPAAKEAGSGARGLLIAIGNLAEGANEKMAKMNYTIKIADALKTVFKGLANITAELIRYFKKLVVGSYDLSGALRKLFKDIANGLADIFGAKGDGPVGEASEDGSDPENFFEKVKNRIVDICKAAVKLFKHDDYSGFENIDSSFLTNLIILVYTIYEKFKTVIVAAKNGIVKTSSIIRDALIIAYNTIFSDAGLASLLLMGLAIIVYEMFENLHTFRSSLLTVSRGLGTKLATDNVADILEQFRLTVMDLAKFAIALSAIYLILPEETADKAIDQSMRIMRAMMTYIAAISAIGMLAQILYTGKINKAMQVGIHAKATQGITIKNNPLGFFEGLIQAYSAPNAMAKIIDESTDFVNKMALGMATFSVAIGIVAYSLKKAPVETERAIELMWEMLGVFLLATGAILIMAGQIINVAVKTNIKADQLTAAAEAIDKFTDFPQTLGTAMMKLFIGIGVFAILLAKAQTMSKTINADVLGMMTVIFMFMALTIAELYAGSYLLYRAISEGKTGKATSHDFNAMSKYIASISDLLEAITAPLGSLLVKVVFLSVFMNKFSNSTDVLWVLGALAAIFAALIVGTLVLFDKLKKGNYLVTKGKDQTTQLEQMASSLAMILNAATRSIKAILKPLLGLSLIFLAAQIITDETQTNAWIPILAALGSILLTLGLVFKGISGILAAAQNTNFNEDAVKVILTVTKTMEKVLYALTFIVAVAAAFVVLTGYYSEQFDTKFDYSIFTAMGIFIAGVGIGLGYLIRSMARAVEDLGNLEYKSWDPNTLFKKLTGIIITLTLLMTLITGVIGAVAIFGDISYLGTALKGLALAFLGVSFGIVLIIGSIEATFQELDKHPLDATKLKTHAALIGGICGFAIVVFMAVTAAVILVSQYSITSEDITHVLEILGVVALAISGMIGLASLVTLATNIQKGANVTGFLATMAIITACIAAIFGLTQLAIGSGLDAGGTLLWMTSFGVAVVAFSVAVFTSMLILNGAKSAAVGAGIVIGAFALGLFAIVGIGTLFVLTVDMLCNAINKLMELAKRKEDLAVIADVMPEIAKNFAIAVEWTMKMLATHSEAIAESVIQTFIIAPLNALAKSMPTIRKALTVIIQELGVILTELAPQAIMDINIFLEEVLYGLVDLSEPLINAIGGIIYNLLVGLKIWIPQWAFALYDGVITLIQKLCDMIRYSDIIVMLLADVFVSLLAAAFNLILPGAGIGDQLFGNIIDGIRKGTRERLDDLGYDMGKGLEGGFRNAMGIHSASKVMKKIGGYIVEGLSDGITGSGGMLSSATDGLIGKITSKFGLDGLFGGLKDQFTGLKDMFSGGADGILGSALGDKTNGLLGDFDISKSINFKINADDPDNVLGVLNNTDGYNVDAMANLGNLGNTQSSASANLGVAGINYAEEAKVRRSVLDEYRRRAARYDDSTVVKLLDGMNSSIQTMGERMLNTQIVMDDGALVGEMKSPLDTELGNMSRLRSRERFATN